MSNLHPDDGSKKAKNITAIIYMLVLIFLVGGSYINQQRQTNVTATAASTIAP